MIPTERLKELVDYDPDTGIFRWKNTRGRKIIGSAHSQGYREAKIDGHRVYLHRLAWLYIYGSAPERQIDHINGVRSDNRICNLRLATQQQNSGNSRISKNNKSGVKGIVIDKRNGAIRAYIHVDYKTRYLGTFQTREDAHAAYIKAAKEHFSEFARAR
jgi:hypothetical protein